MCEATFRSSTPRSYLNITYPVYAEVNRSNIKNQTVVYKGYGLALVQAVALIFFCPQC